MWALPTTASRRDNSARGKDKKRTVPACNACGHALSVADPVSGINPNSTSQTYYTSRW